VAQKPNSAVLFVDDPS